MKKAIQSFVLTVLCLTQKESVAYDNFKAHPALNAAMVNFAEVIIKTKLPDGVTLGFSSDPGQYVGKAVTDPGKTVLDYGESDESHNAVEWIKHGGFSADEPELQAAVRHFYDPVGLIGGKKWLTNRGTYWEGAYSIPMNPETDAIEWALGDTPKGESNRYTLAKAKESLVDALELADETMKKSNLAKAFRSLGEVLHNTGDMGCPPHTRNDSHAAPLGFSGGAVLGSPDPYEELFNPDWALTYELNTPDPELKSFFENATTIRSIDEKLASFTNENFFTEQTINGSGINNLVRPINKEDTYYSPNLQDQEITYNASDYTYYRTFQSGNRVKMCTDKHGFIINYRGYPRMDAACVQSQAQELVPDLLCAGAHIIRLFIPKLKVEITEAKTDGTVKGTVTHVKTAEYNETIYYSGKIHILNDFSGQTVGTVDCATGTFSGSVGSLGENDEVYATIEIGGIQYKSAPYRIKRQVYVFNFETVRVSLDARMPSDKDGFDYHVFSITNDETWDKLYKPLTWSGNTFSVSHEYNDLENATFTSYRIDGELAPDASKLINFHAEHVYKTSYYYTYPDTFYSIHVDSMKIALQNLPVDYIFSDMSSLYFHDEGDNLKNIITNFQYGMYYFKKYATYTIETDHAVATTIDWNSTEQVPEIDVYFNKK